MAKQQGFPLLRGSLLQLLLAIGLIMLSVAQAAPTIGFPINSQVPRVARVGNDFNFTFTANTFDGIAGNVTYSLQDSPTWLNLNPLTRSFTGIPIENDVGPSTFNVVATDGFGSVSMPVTFIVSNTVGPQLGAPIGTSISTSGTLSGSRTVLLYPGAPISLAVNESTFINTDLNTQYYAICSNNTPLPSWLSFDPANLSFGGTTPVATSPNELPQDYEINVIASDVPGFSSAVFQFSLTVQIHQLVFSSQINISIVENAPLTFEDLKNELLLDGKPIDIALIQSIEADLPDWLSLDNSTLNLFGFPPAERPLESFNIKITDVYGDEASTLISLSSGNHQQLLNASVPTILATVGGSLSFVLPPELFLTSGLTVSLDLGDCSSWLSYDETTHLLAGTVPETVMPQTEYLNLTVSKGTDSTWEQIPLIISPAATSTTMPTSASQPSETAALGSPSSSSAAEHTRLVQGLAITFGLIALIIIILVTLLCIRRRESCCFRGTARRGSAGTYEQSLRSPTSKRTSLQYRLSYKEPGQIEFTGYPWDHRNEQIRSGIDKNRRSQEINTIPDDHVDAPAPTKKAIRLLPGIALFGNNPFLGLGHGHVFPGPQKEDIEMQQVNAQFYQRRRVVPSHPRGAQVTIKRTTGSSSSRNSIETIGGNLTRQSPKGRRPFPRLAGLVRRAAYNYNGLYQARPWNPEALQSADPTIRRVPKSPDINELPSPDLSGSPRKQKQAYIHERAKAGTTSGGALFTSKSAQLDIEKDLIQEAIENEHQPIATPAKAYRPTVIAPERAVYMGAVSDSPGPKQDFTVMHSPPRSTRVLEPNLARFAADASRKNKFERPVVFSSSPSPVRSRSPIRRRKFREEGEDDESDWEDDIPYAPAPSALVWRKKAACAYSGAKAESVRRSQLLEFNLNGNVFPLGGERTFTPVPAEKSFPRSDTRGLGIDLHTKEVLPWSNPLLEARRKERDERIKVATKKVKSSSSGVRLGSAERGSASMKSSQKDIARAKRGGDKSFKGNLAFM